MWSDDVIYALLLLISLPIGQLIKSADTPRKRQFVSTIVGVMMVMVVCKQDALHSFFSAFINCMILTCVSPRFCHKLSFIWGFGYIVFFRTTTYFSLPPVTPHANAVQLLLTLKMVGLGFEIHDSWESSCEELRTNEPSASLRHKYRDISPSFIDMMTYYFCYIGVMTGPYYKYRTYYDMLHDIDTKQINTFNPVFQRLIYVIPAAAVYLFVSHHYNIQYVKSDVFYTDRTFLYRLWYMVPMFVVFRTRLYIAWIVSECVCMTATLGAYPLASKPRCGGGPTDYVALEESKRLYDEHSAHDDSSESTRSEIDASYSFETIHNIDVYGCELAPTVREGMRAWNQTVQYWLASYVYKRLAFKSGPLRVATTMMVSAFWHGVHAGYYLSFITIPINLIAEDIMILTVRRRGTVSQEFFDWLCWFGKMRMLDYMCMAFLLLGLTDTLRYWSSIYFIGHIFIFTFIAVGNIIRMKQVSGSKSEDRSVRSSQLSLAATDAMNVSRVKED